jgi:hypothetical protein
MQLLIRMSSFVDWLLSVVWIRRNRHIESFSGLASLFLQGPASGNWLPLLLCRQGLQACKRCLFGQTSFGLANYRPGRLKYARSFAPLSCSTSVAAGEALWCNERQRALLYFSAPANIALRYPPATYASSMSSAEPPGPTTHTAECRLKTAMIQF